MDNLTRQQSIALLSFTAGILVVNSFAAKAVSKNHDDIVKRYAKLAEVGESLSRITTYQSKLMNKHIDLESLDEFDRMVMEDMAVDLNTTLAEFHRLNSVEEAAKS